MKRSMAVVLMLVALAACGDDEEPEVTPQQSAAQRAAQQARMRADSIRRDSIARVRATTDSVAGAETAARAVRPGERVYTVQVASYLSAQSAEQLRRRLEQQGVPVWTSQGTANGRTFTRVRVGAVGSVADARRLGARITRQYGWPVWVAPVRAGESIPQSVVSGTARYMSG